MKTDAEIANRMKQLEKNRPNVYGNMLLIGLLQLISLLGAIGLLIYAAILLSSHHHAKIVDRLCEAISEEFEWTNIQLALICLVAGILLLFINILTKMINRRNAFLMDFLDILDPDEKK